MVLPDRVVIILISSMGVVVLQVSNSWVVRSDLSNCKGTEVLRVRKSMERSCSCAISDGLDRFPDVALENRVCLVGGGAWDRHG